MCDINAPVVLFAADHLYHTPLLLSSPYEGLDTAITHIARGTQYTGYIEKQDFYWDDTASV